MFSTLTLHFILGVLNRANNKQHQPGCCAASLNCSQICFIRIGVSIIAILKDGVPSLHKHIVNKPSVLVETKSFFMSRKMIKNILYDTYCCRCSYILNLLLAYLKLEIFSQTTTKIAQPSKFWRPGAYVLNFYFLHSVIYSWQSAIFPRGTGFSNKLNSESLLNDRCFSRNNKHFLKTLRFTSLSDKMNSFLYSTYILINDTDIFEYLN